MCPNYCGLLERGTALEIPLQRVRRRKVGEGGMDIIGASKNTEVEMARVLAEMMQFEVTGESSGSQGMEARIPVK